VQYQTVPDSYGTVEVRISEGAELFAELVRIKRGNAGIEFAAPTLVR